MDDPADTGSRRHWNGADGGSDATAVPGEPIELTPAWDPVLRQLVYMDVAVSGGEIRAERRRHDEGDTAVKAAVHQDSALQTLSVLPTGRMAGDNGWEEVKKALGAAETRRDAPDVELRPGGELVVRQPNSEVVSTSVLPTGRMASVVQGPDLNDMRMLQELDPDNVEQWQPVTEGELTGWTFRFNPGRRDVPDFHFFAFRSPSDRNLWRITPIRPNLDHMFGHSPHMIKAYVGGTPIPVICGPDGAPAPSLREVRTWAAKWTRYWASRLANEDPGFSL